MGGVGGSKKRCVGSGEVWGGCGKVYGASGEVCWHVGKGCGEGNGEDVGKCVEVWAVGLQHTFNSPHLPTLTFPYISLYLPHTPSHFPTPPFIPLPTSLLPPPTPQHIFLLSPHISLHLLKVWQSYHATKFLWRSYCGEVTMWRSYWQPLSIRYMSCRKS